MIRKRALVIFLLLAIAYPATVLAQREATSSTASLPPQLTLEDAVSLALENNRLVKNSVLEAQKFDFRVSTPVAGGYLSFNFPQPVANCCSRLISRLRGERGGRSQGLGPSPQLKLRFTHQHGCSPF